MADQNAKINPRIVPDRDSKYMGEAWMKAAFSKDPNTQVGAVIVSPDNYPLGSGYNGPPKRIDDNSFSWERPPRDNPDAFSKYDVIVHAEINAMDHSMCSDLSGSTLYVTAMPCPDCMLEIIRKQISRVVYYDFQSSYNSSLQNADWREKSEKLAAMGRVRLEKFNGNLHWITDWTIRLRDLHVLQ
jgi:dCMP deaminase